MEEIRRFKTAAGIALVIGWMLVAWAGYALLGHPGGALAVGLPLMIWGASAILQLAHAEALLKKLDN